MQGVLEPPRFIAALVMFSAGLSALGLFSAPALAELRCDWQALAAGELWRIVTGPLVHANLEHALRDLLALSILGALLEPRLPRAVAVTVISALLLAPLLTWAAHPQLIGYLGTSPAAYALFALWIFAPWRRPRPRWLLLLGVLLLARSIWHVFSGPPLLALAGVHSVPLTHLAGILVGAGVGYLGSLPGDPVFLGGVMGEYRA